MFYELFSLVPFFILCNSRSVLLIYLLHYLTCIASPVKLYLSTRPDCLGLGCSRGWWTYISAGPLIFQLDTLPRFRVSFLGVQGWVDPRGHNEIERILCQWKIPITPARIEPATIRFVAQHLNHWATAVPVLPCTLAKFVFFVETDIEKHFSEMTKNSHPGSPGFE